MRRRATAWPVRALILSLVLISPALGEDKKIEGDLKKLQGVWTTAGEGAATYAFDGSKLKVVGKNRTYEIVVTLDEKAKPEKSIDMKIEEAPDDAKGKVSRGIYKFDGDSFVLCFRGEGGRPDKFEMVGFEQIVLTMTREKK